MKNKILLALIIIASLGLFHLSKINELKSSTVNTKTEQHALSISNSKQKASTDKPSDEKEKSLSYEDKIKALTDPKRKSWLLADKLLNNGSKIIVERLIGNKIKLIFTDNKGYKKETIIKGNLKSINFNSTGMLIASFFPDDQNQARIELFKDGELISKLNGRLHTVDNSNLSDTLIFREESEPNRNNGEYYLSLLDKNGKLSKNWKMPNKYAYFDEANNSGFSLSRDGNTIAYTPLDGSSKGTNSIEGFRISDGPGSHTFTHSFDLPVTAFKLIDENRYISIMNGLVYSRISQNDAVNWVRKSSTNHPYTDLSISDNNKWVLAYSKSAMAFNVWELETGREVIEWAPNSIIHAATKPLEERYSAYYYDNARPAYIPVELFDNNVLAYEMKGLDNHTVTHVLTNLNDVNSKPIIVDIPRYIIGGISHRDMLEKSVRLHKNEL